jgi:toxin ParE1/3/4
MPNLIKRPIVIQDLVTYSDYISIDNLDAGDRFLYAAEATFQQIARTPGIGRLSGFTDPSMSQIRQYPVKGFKKYLVIYQLIDDTIDVIRVIHGSRDLEHILNPDNPT